MIRLHRTLLPLLAPIVLLACDNEGIVVLPEVEESYGFESGLASWTPLTGTGNTGSVEVALTSEAAAGGSSSVRLGIDDPDGDAFALLTRSFDVEPSTAYDVEVSFRLGTSDGPTVQGWSVLGGASADEPSGSTGLADAGSTTASGVELTFESRSVSMVRSTGGDGVLWITLGVAQQSAGSREYFVDDVQVTLTRR